MHVVIFCFAHDNLNSFNSIKNFWIPEIEERNNKVMKVLVGLKPDLHKIEREAIDQLNFEGGFSQYFECNPKTGENVQELFKTAVQDSL